MASTIVTTTTKFDKIWGGKIFADNFETVRLRDDDKYFVGDVHDIVLDGVSIGQAKIVAVKNIRLEAIRDVLSFSTAGMPAAKFCGWLKTIYNEKVHGGVKPSTEFTQVVYQWQQRNYACQTGYIAKFMEQRLLDWRQALTND